ncbi:hypothetical protein PInf_024644 [Phytophthora infestans]|nr:hypothetical protein PInf_024644 [Phytophthora infestans]
MESVEGDNSHDEFDPDDLDGPSPSSAVVATAAAGAGGSSMIRRVRISAISDLKEFTGKDRDEDRARTWISKVKSALISNQASDAEKCLTFADLLAGPARNWYRQLGRSTRNKWPDLLRSFQTQYCGLVVSVARQYYHAHRRSDESQLEYLYRLNVAGLRAKLKIKDGGSKVLREHVDHFIETLRDVDQADRLTLLRLPDADKLEEVLRAVDRAKHRQKKAAVGSGKYRSDAHGSSSTCPQVTAPDSGTESGSDGSDSDPENYRRVCLTASNDRTAKTGDNSRSGDTLYCVESSVSEAKVSYKTLSTASPVADTTGFANTEKSECSWILVELRLMEKWKLNEGQSAVFPQNLDAGNIWSVRSVARKVIPEIIASTRVAVVARFTTSANLAGQDAILGMDFMVLAGVRLDLADGTLCFPDEMRIQLSGRRPLYGEKMRILRADKTTWIEPGETWELPDRLKWVEHEKLWVTRGDKWVPTVIQGPGRSQYLQVTNVSDKRLLLDHYQEIGRWLANDGIPRRPGYVSVGSRRYKEWQNLAYEATTEIESLGEGKLPAEPTGPLVDRPSYPTPRKILQRDRRIEIQAIEVGSKTGDDPRSNPLDNSGSVDEGSQRAEAGSPDPADPRVDPSFSWDKVPGFLSRMAALVKQEPSCLNSLDDQVDPTGGFPGTRVPDPTKQEGLTGETGSRCLDPMVDPMKTEDEQVCYHEGGDLHAEDLGEGLSVIPEVPLTAEEVTIDDIQVDPGANEPAEVDRLRQKIWENRHLLIGKGNALPPAARGVK